MEMWRDRHTEQQRRDAVPEWDSIAITPRLSKRFFDSHPHPTALSRLLPLTFAAQHAPCILQLRPRLFKRLASPLKPPFLPAYQTFLNAASFDHTRGSGRIPFFVGSNLIPLSSPPSLNMSPGLRHSSIAGRVRSIALPSKPHLEIHIGDDQKPQTYIHAFSTTDKIQGHISVFCSHDTPFDDVEILLLG